MKQLILAVTVTAAGCLLGIGSMGQALAQTGAGKAAPATTRPTAGQFFKAVTTSTLKGLTVDDFMGSMGVMAAALGYDCADCHPGAGYDNADFVKDTPKKIIARRMVEMVATINKSNFGGTQLVTCWSCHHGRERPSTTITLDHLYGPQYDEKDDIVEAGKGGPTANEILDKYLKAIGGTEKLAGLKSFVATGSASVFTKLGEGGTFQIFAQAPDRRAVTITYKDHPERGDSVRTFDGRTGWIKSPRAFLGQYELTGGELDGARLDAQLSFPGQIKTALTNLKSGFTDIINDHDVEVVQGTGPHGLLVTLYFDSQSGLLTRMVRFNPSPIGRVPVQVDYDDYRDVGGVKFPFKYTFSWLDGRDSFQLTDVKTNVPIDASKFAKP